MSAIVVFALVWAVGVLIGALISGMILLEHSVYWTVFLRLPRQLHADLRRAARSNFVSVHTETIDRLLASFEERS
jgi:hypothetical protein